MGSVTTTTCPRCEERPKAVSRAGRVASYCNPCHQEKLKALRAANPGRSRELQRASYRRNWDKNIKRSREWHERNRKRKNEYSKAWYRKNEPWKDRVVDPVKDAARNALRSAVQCGRVAKPDRCDSCGKVMPPGELGGHHPDYAKPLDVEWLCAICHGIKHRRAS